MTADACAFVALPAAPALAHDGAMHVHVEACGTTLTITEDRSKVNEKFEVGVGFKSSGVTTVHVVAEDGRELTFTSAGQFRVETLSPGTFAIRETGRKLFYPTNPQEAEELARVGMPTFGVFAGQARSTFTGVPFGPGTVTITQVPNNVRSACGLLR